MRLLAPLSALLSLVAAAARTSPPEGAIVVTKNPKCGQFSTVQAAIDSLSTTSDESQSIFIDQGKYEEQIFIPERSSQLTIYGYTTDSYSYLANEVTLTWGLSSAEAGNNDLSGSVRNHATNTRFYNLNIANTFGPGSQAIALSAQNGKQGYYGCKLTGYQDTLLSNSGNQLYSRSLITGRTDFIFGQRARSWFEDCDIGVVADGIGYVTALGRDSESNPGYYAFNNCRVEAAEGEVVKDGDYFLGRPWRSYARVVFQNTEMSKVINDAGWTVWNQGDSDENLEFGEYNNSGPGAVGPRASFTQHLDSPVEIATVLEDDYESWVDAEYL